jgi:hypothetical protein
MAAAGAMSPAATALMGLDVGDPTHEAKLNALTVPELKSVCTHDDDRPFIVLTETKFSLCCIPVWIGTLLTGLGSKKTHVIMFSP